MYNWRSVVLYALLLIQSMKMWKSLISQEAPSECLCNVQAFFMKLLVYGMEWHKDERKPEKYAVCMVCLLHSWVLCNIMTMNMLPYSNNDINYESFKGQSCIIHNTCSSLSHKIKRIQFIHLTLWIHTYCVRVCYLLTRQVLPRDPSDLPDT